MLHSGVEESPQGIVRENQHAPKQVDGEQIISGIRKLQSKQGNYVSVGELREHLGLAKDAPALDKAVIKLADEGQLVLGRYDGPRDSKTGKITGHNDVIYDERREPYIGLALPKESHALPPSDIERYQFLRNKEGGQTFGSQAEIRPLTREVYRQEVEPRLRRGFANSFEDYQAKTGATHYKVQRNVDGRVLFDGAGTVAELRPDLKWAKRVESFDSPEAKAHGLTADSDRYGKTGGAIPEPNGSSLFGREETKAIADTAAADKARLERERMEAQLKSPITREEQLRKLKRSTKTQAGDLFGGEPEQSGFLFSRHAPGSNARLRLRSALLDRSESATSSGALFGRDLNRERFIPGSSYDYNSVFKNADWELHPATPNKQATLRLNWQAAEIVGQLGYWGKGLYGVSIPDLSPPVSRIRHKAEKLLDRGEIDYGVFTKVNRLADAMVKAGADGKPAVLRRSDIASSPIGEAPRQQNQQTSRMADIRSASRTEREELIHSGQLSSNAGQFEDHVDEKLITSHKDWPEIEAAIRRSGYGDAKPSELIAEAGAKLSAGFGEKLGIDRSKTQSFLSRYYLALERKLGTEGARKVLRYAEPDTRRLLGIDRGSSIRSASSGTPAGEIQKESFGGSSQSSTGIVRRVEDEGNEGFGREVRRDVSADQTLFSRTDDDEGRVNYSGLGAFETKAVRNLSQLRRASDSGFLAAARAASSRSQAAVIMKTAMPRLVKALGPVNKDDFFRALIQSRLMGIRERWSQMSGFAGRASDDNLRSSMENVLPVLEHLEDRAGFGRNLADTAGSLLEKGDLGTLRQFLGQTFDQAARGVATVMDPGEFDGLRHLPEFQRGLTVYKNLVEQPMAESHDLNEGVFSTALGPLDTYYPLVPVDKAEHGPQAPRGDRQQYARPKNLNNNFATGLAEDYEASSEALRNSLSAATYVNNKAALMDALEENGLVRKLGPMERGGDRVLYRGQEYDAVKMETSPARTVVKNGKSTTVPARSYLVPRWLHQELEPVLTRKDKVTPSAIQNIVNKANTIAISGPADFVFHTSNLFGTLVANTPFLGNSLLGKAGSVPMLKKFVAIGKVLATDPTTEEAAADLQEMAKLGILPDRYGSETYSKQYADLTGAELKRFGTGPLLYGPKGVDVRARLVMYRLAKEIDPKASGPALHMFVNQLGTYVDALQSGLVRGAKRYGLAPFAEAGTRMNANGINAWLGTSPMPKRGAGLRIWQQLTGGGLGTVALWMLAYKAYTGQYPWQDKRSKLLQIPANPKDRASRLGKMLWGKGSDVGYLNFGFFNPLANRGARALGIKGAADTAHAGGKWWQDFESAQKDAMNSFAHPFLGPLPRAAFVGLTGTQPYLTGLRDDRARFAPQLLPATRGGAGNSIPRRAMGAAKELNSFYGNVSAATGLGETSNPHDTSNRWVRMAADLALPGLVGNATNPYQQHAKVVRQAVAAQRQK